MDPITPLHQATLILNGERDTSETPHAQEPHKPYTHTSPCHHQGCLVCCTPTNPSVGHQPFSGTPTLQWDTNPSVGHQSFSGTPTLQWETNPSVGNQPLSGTSTQDDDQLPHPPPDHLILIITAALKRAILEKDITLLKSYVHQYLHQLETNLEFFKYNCSDLEAYYLTAEDILTSHSALSTPPPAPPLPTKPDLPTYLIPISYPDSPTYPASLLKPNPPTNPGPPKGPDSAANPASPPKPDPQSNLENISKPIPPTNSIPPSNPDPPTNPDTPNNPKPITELDYYQPFIYVHVY